MRFWLLLFLPLVLFARDIPSLSGPVIDEVGVLSAQQNAQLSKVLRAVNNKHDLQLQVFIARNMDGDVIENFAIKAVDQWKLGSEKSDRGVLFVLAMEEKKVRIEVGQGLEGEITDAQAGMLIESLTPYFRKGDFAGGILTAVHGLLVMAGIDNVGETTGMKRQTKSKPIGAFTLLLFIIFIIFEIITRSRRGGIFFGGHGSSSRMGGGGFSGGGGGGWSGGGGGFSGGGASGGW